MEQRGSLAEKRRWHHLDDYHRPHQQRLRIRHRRQGGQANLDSARCPARIHLQRSELNGRMKSHNGRITLWDEDKEACASPSTRVEPSPTASISIRENLESSKSSPPRAIQHRRFCRPWPALAPAKRWKCVTELQSAPTPCWNAKARASHL